MPSRRFAPVALLALLSVLWCSALGAAEDVNEKVDAKDSGSGGSVSTASLLAPLSQGKRLDLPSLDPQVPRPEAILGAPLGAQFNHWERILDYLTALDAASDRVVLSDYGRTAEGRRLVLLAISTPGNLAKLEEIQRDHQRLADPGSLTAAERERLIARTPSVVWLAYGVHGNESSSAEAAMGAAYVLAAGEGDVARQLERTVVLIDPLMNPDGRERYLSTYEQRRGAEPNPRREAAEHTEPWPSGRVNHYLIDLNRDWAWATQPETRARLAAYRSWEPQVFVDFHEMGTDSTYFFPPAAEPILSRIPHRTLSWLETFGRANAATFDRLGWVYFKQENYDLLYPGYGDSYPSLRGAVGMTYEMAGGGRAGELLTRSDGTRIALADRVAHHLATSLATFATAAGSSRRLLEDFVANRLESAVGPGRLYAWSPEQPEARALADLFALHGIRVSQLKRATELRVRAPEGGDESPRRFPAGTFVVTSGQPLGPLVEALLERRTQLSDRFIDRQKERQSRNLDSEFYDITAWSLPLAFNLEVWIAAPGAPGLAGLEPLAPVPGALSGEGTLGLLIEPRGLASYQLAMRLRAQGLALRVALRDFRAGDHGYPSGTLFVPRYGNPPDFEARAGAALQDLGLSASRLATSFDIEGLSLGSRDMPTLRPVRLGLIGGDGVDTTSFGALWFLFDHALEAPVDRLDLDRLGDLDLAAYDALILPDGSYGDRITEKRKERLDAWVKSGGVLIGIAGAISWLQDAELTTVENWKAPDDPESPGDPANAATAASDPAGETGPPSTSEKSGGASESAPDASAKPASTPADRAISTPGAAFATRMTPGHPLAIGIPKAPPVLIDGDLVLQTTGDPQQDVLTVAPEAPLLSGFAFPEAEQRLAGSLLASVESHGHGAIVLFAQEPSYRLFWRGTMPLLLNAALYGPSLGLGGR
ncbi:MAG TPA: M14 family zinc carboxypeptidase [Thermoanaerobaculia bacterium]|nr:M14 family zinc carboxypeptidase [Thermoanaerobaculia bacterium]